MEDTRFACSLTLSQCDDQTSRARYSLLLARGTNCDGSYCKIPNFTLPKLGIIPDFAP